MPRRPRVRPINVVFCSAAVIGVWGAPLPSWGQFGVPISDPAPLNTNAATDTGSDSAPEITTDGLGNWVVVWRSNEDLGGTLGTERDVAGGLVELQGPASDW